MKSLIINEKRYEKGLALIVSFCKNLTQRESRGSSVGCPWVVRESMNRRWSVDGALMEDRWSHDSAKNANMQMCKIANLHFCKSGKAHLARLAAMLLMIVTLGVGEVWGATGDWLPDVAKVVKSNETVYCTDLSVTPSPATGWYAMPAKGDQSASYSNVTSDKNGNPGGITDNLPNSSSVSMHKLAAVGSSDQKFNIDKKMIHMRVKGVETVIVHGYTGSTNRGLALHILEVTGSVTASSSIGTEAVSQTRSNNAGCFILQKTGLDSSKEYFLTIMAKGGDASFYAIEFIAGASSCDTYSFRYRDFGSFWHTLACFSTQKNGTDYITDEVELPVGDHFYVGWGDNWSDSHSLDNEIQYMYAGVPGQNNNYQFGNAWQVGNVAGAKGYFHIYTDSGEKNKAIRFVPSGYTLQFGSGESWSNDKTLVFAPASLDVYETTWKTELTQLTSAQIGKQIWVGYQTSEGYVWCPKSQKENLRGLRTKTTGGAWLDGGLPDSYNGVKGKFVMYANSGDNNFYVTFIPYFNATFVKNNGDANEETELKSVEVTNNVTFPSPTRTGYTLEGWYDNEGLTGTKYNAGSQYDLDATTGSKTFYAKWTVAAPAPAACFSMVVKNPSSSTSDSNLDLSVGKDLESLSGGSVSQNGLDGNIKDKGLRFGNNADYIAITLSGATLAQGSKIIVTYNNGTANQGVGFGPSTSAPSWTAGTNCLQSSSTGAHADQEFTVPAGSPLIGKSTFYVFRAGGNSVFLSKLSVTDCGGASSTYTITFDKDGKGTTTATQTGVPGNTATALKTIATIGWTMTGNTFAGWAETVDGAVAYTDGANITITADKTLYAKWTKNNYTVTLDNQSATTPGAASVTVTYGSKTNIASGSPVAPVDIEMPAKTGHTFGGYYTAVDGGGVKLIDEDGHFIADVSGYTDANYTWKKASNVTLYAKWTPDAPAATYDVTVHDEAVGCEKTLNDVAVGATVDIQNTCDVPGKHLTGYTPNTVPNYSFDAKTKTLTFNMPASNVTLTAVWEADVATTYTVTYNGNGNTGGVAPTDPNSPYNEGAQVTVLDNTGSLVKTGYVFSGWNTAADDSGTKYAAGDKFTISADVTLYARWKAQYTVTLNSNGGTANGSAKVVVGSKNVTDISDPTHATYSTIEGFYADQECTTKVMNADHTLVPDVAGWTTGGGNWNKSENATLYAKWIVPACFSFECTLENATVAHGASFSTVGTLDGGTMVFERSGESMTVTGDGVKFNSGNEYVRIELSSPLQVGSVISAKIKTGGNDRGVAVCDKNKTQKFALNTPSSTAQIVSHTIEAGDGLAGAQVIYLVRSTGNTAYLQSMTITNCGGVVNVTGVTLNKTATSIEQGQNETLTATVAPADASDKSVTWTSDNESVATVVDGVVTAVAPGSATITVRTTDGGRTATCNVTVTAIPTYTITFVANGATGSVPTETAKTAGTKFTLPAATGLTYADHAFVGWKSSANDVTYNAGEQYTMTAANTTFTAQWRESAEYHTIVPNIEDTRYESYSLHTIFTNTTTVSPTFPWVSGSLAAFGSTWTIPSGEVRYKNDGQTDAKFKANVVTFKVTNCVSVAIAGKSGGTSRSISISVKEKDSDVEVGTVASSNLNSYKSVVYGSALDPNKKYVVSITSSDPGNNSYIGAISFEAPGLTPAATPMITTQPVQPEAYCAGNAITALTVAATTSDAGTLSYQWYKGDTKVGTNSTSYTPTEAGVYKCVVKNTLADHDPATVASDVVTITINAATAITNQPTASQTVPAGSPVSLTVAATGTDLSYQWKSCATVDGEYTPIMTVAAGKATYTFTPNAVGDTYYKCAVTGACGTVTSNAALVTVTTAAPTVTWNTETSAYQGQLLTVSVTTNSDAALNVNDLITNAGTLVDKQLVGKTYTAKLQVPTDATGTITLTLNIAAGATFGALESNHEIAISGSCPDSGTETLYSFQITSLDQNVTTEQTAIGGTATFGKTLLKESSVATNRIAAKLDGNPAADNTKYVLVKLKKALKNGDVVTVKGYTANTPEAPYSFVISDSRTATNRYATLTNTAKNTEEELQFTVSSVATGLGATQFYISRNTGSVFLTGVTVTSTGSATTLTWDDAEVSSGSTVEKTIGDADFTIPAISNSIGTISYTSGTTGTATVNASGTVHIVNTGTTVITATVADAGCYAGKSITYTLRVNAACEAPVITKDLSTDIVEYKQGASATDLSISATGSNLHYQWYKNTTDDTENGMAVGTDAASYTPITTALGTTYYYCVVSSGACTTTSAVAKIVVMADACYSDATETALDGSAVTYVIDLGAGSSFEAGTVIYGRVKVGTVKGGDGVKVQNTIINICAGTNIAAKDTWYDFTYVVPANSPLIGQQSITLVRATGTNTRIKDVKVTGCGTPCALPQPLIVAGTPDVDHETCQETVLLTAKTPDGTANYNIGGGTMQWYKDGEAIPSATAVTYMVTEEGTYYVMFTNGCSVMSSNSYIEKNLEPGVQRLAPLQYYHVGKTYTEQMKDRHLFVVNSFGLHDGNTYLLEAKLNGEEYNVTTIRSAIYTIADDDVANTDTVMIDLNALNGKGFNVGDKLVLSVSPVNLCGNYVDDLKQSITICMIDETPTLAFIVSGADGEGTKTKSKLKLNGDFLTGYNKADLKTQTSATAVSEAELPLYTALRSEFNVTPVNGYAVFNIFNYEPFDLLFLTDFVKSDGSADKAAAKKHVEALGNLVDYRPMFSTKGHMSGFNNWKEKGFTANPTVPKQTQVLMNIVCYAHPMFEGLTPDGENIYYDAIDNNETVFRMLSQGGYDSNKGIQGFEMNGANEFIKIALTHYDAHGTPDGNIMTPTAEADDRTLIASCERQANIEARFIILSLNADATSFLTEAGIDVIIRSLSYLLETNPIKVTDCHFDFDNAHGTGVWSDPANWAPRHNVLPTKNVDVRISANCRVDNTSAVAASVRVKDGFTLTIADTAALTIQGIAQHQNAEGKLSPTSPSDLVVSGSSTGTGAFIHGDEAGKTGATVQMYSPATATVNAEGTGATHAIWQWITTPYNDVADAQYNYYGAWMYSWDNANKAWSPQVTNGNGMTPFGGYAITQENAMTYTMTGTLVGTANQTIALNYNTANANGLNLIGNSWTAPIDITKMSTTDFTNATANIIMFNTGIDVDGSGTVTSDGTDPRTAGTYVSIPVETASSLPASLQVIPAMQGFEVKATATDASLKLDYSKIVRGTDAVNIQPMRAPGRRVVTSENGIDERLLIMVHGSRYSDFLYLFHNAETSMGFDNGWDGEKMYSDNYDIPVLYVENTDGDWQISTQPELAGTTFGFYKGEDTWYTVSFEYDGNEKLWFYDAATGIYTEVETGNIYSFSSTFVSDDPERRFVLTNYNPNAPQNPGVATGVDDVSPSDGGPRKLILDDKLFILNNGHLYDATGRLAY